MLLPDEIAIFRGPINRVARNRTEAVHEVRETLIHELGHYFGLDDEEMPPLMLYHGEPGAETQASFCSFRRRSAGGCAQGFQQSIDRDGRHIEAVIANTGSYEETGAIPFMWVERESPVRRTVHAVRDRHDRRARIRQAHTR